MKKVIVITGATGGLGREIVKHFENQDVRLALHTFNQEPFEVKAEHAWFKADLSDSSQVDNFINLVNLNFGKVDVLINNAGISTDGMSWKLQVSDFQKVMAVNLNAPFQLIQGFLPQMREQNFGRIVSISSVVGQTGVPGTSAYTASKAGLIGLTKTIAKEVANKKITVNCIALGYFEKGMIDELSDEMKELVISQIPKKRLGDVSSLLKTIDFLISDESDYLTGQSINLNGGLFA